MLLLSTIFCTAYCLVGGSLYAFPSFSNALQHYGYAHIALLGSLGNVSNEFPLFQRLREPLSH